MVEKIGRFHCFYVKIQTEEILERNSEVWNLCKRSGHIGGTQAAPATIARSPVLVGPKIYEFVFDNSGILSEKCCEQLLNAGRECHDSDTNSILSEGEFSKEEREEILARHSEVWNLCKRSGHIGGTQPVPAPTVQPLTGCAGKVTSACGPKVYAFVFDKSGVLSEKCCELLLNAGRQCHDSETNSILSEGEFSAEEKKEIMKDTIKSGTFARRMCHDNLTNSILSKGGFSTEETEEILERNSEVWNLCKRSGHIGGTQAAPATIIQPLKGCAGKVTSACGPKIYEFVFDNSGILSEKCCEQLLNAGRECHDSDTNSILSEGEFSEEEREEILARHSEVWNLCKRSDHIGGTQPVPAPTVQPLTGCAGKVTSACGPKVYAFVFDKRGVLSEKCCELLLNAGRQCHDSETNSILSEGEFSAEEKKEIMKRHNQVWNLCKKNGGFSTEETEEILERNSEVWNLCKRSGHIGGPQAAPATIVQPLKGCAGKVTSACGPKIYEFYWQGHRSFGTLYDDRSTFEALNHYQAPTVKPLTGCQARHHACGPKVYASVFDKRWRRQCHDSETNSILSEENFLRKKRRKLWKDTIKSGTFARRMEILERNSEVWNLCKRSGHIGGTQAAPATIIQPLKGCAGKVPSACGPKIYEFVFDNSGILSEKCCEQLLNAGRECHDSDTNSILREGEFSKEEREEILARHREVWNLCKRSGHIGGTQPVPAPTVQPLTGCAGKVTSACGPKVYVFVFDKSGVMSEKCCELLLNAGRQCHDSETNSILSGGEFSAEEKKEIMKRHNQEILERNSEVWNLCKRSGHIGGTQATPATIVQPLKGCAGKVTSACGPKVYAFGFDKSGVLSEKCCELLLNAGRQCHDSETNSILSEGEFSTEEKKEIMKRHNQVWNFCRKNGHIDIKNTVF
ncbi:hypothetical protein Cgig2_008603 [Carnegiea gigantea]|uniref:Prolamin-like domain-containing protein n=1 Tax=Carnegiea gigantea TaxID=171969 RepID=A0A9Q1GHI6_9CARY|nr:hypothetical protein Cgig2_008603 [Carnegiea gigantea]